MAVRLWTDSETEYLKASHGSAVRDIALKLGRTPRGIEAKAKSLGMDVSGGIIEPEPRPNKLTLKLEYEAKLDEMLEELERERRIDAEITGKMRAKARVRGYYD